ncbi:MAG: LuxR C-terminal-related transcriptional regulator [Acidimicrobiia bacterium]
MSDQERVKTITVVVAADSELMRRGLRDLLGACADVVVLGEAANAGDAVRMAVSLAPDIVVLDMQFTDLDPLAACREIKAASRKTSCVMLAAAADEDALRNAITAGASSYLLKQSDGVNIVKAVRAVASGKRLIDNQRGEASIEKLRDGSVDDPLLAMLSGQERRVLALIADGRTNRDIAAELGLAEKTVKNYVSNLLGKMGVESRTQAAVYAVRALGRAG